MNVFTRVARAGSFAGGARDTGISRAMATKHIMQLENYLGVRLFNRTTRSLSLTEVGAAYLNRCQQVLGEIEEMESAVTHLHSQARGKLKINTPPFIGSSHVAPAIAHFLEKHPDLNVDMLIQSSLGDFVDEGIDIAIFLGKLEDTSLIARKLASSPMVICGAPDYFSKHGVPETPQELESHSCLINWAIAPRDNWQFTSPEGEVLSMKVTGRLQTNQADPLRTAAINGLGIIKLPTYVVGHDIKKGKLKRIFNDYQLPPLEIYAVYPHRKHLSAKVRLFIDFFQPWLQRRIGVIEG